jgi:transcriptional regulator with XRE-family HTH domain
MIINNIVNVKEKEIGIIMQRNYIDRGNRLKQWWKSTGWQKAEFARKMEIWPQNVNKYFRGELDPTSLAEQLIREECDLGWIVTGKTTSQLARRGMVAEPPVVYGGKNELPKGIGKQTKARIIKLTKLLESGLEKADLEMLDLFIKTMEEKQKK